MKPSVVGDVGLAVVPDVGRFHRRHAVEEPHLVAGEGDDPLDAGDGGGLRQDLHGQPGVAGHLGPDQHEPELAPAEHVGGLELPFAGEEDHPVTAGEQPQPQPRRLRRPLGPEAVGLGAEVEEHRGVGLARLELVAAPATRHARGDGEGPVAETLVGVDGRGHDAARGQWPFADDAGRILVAPRLGGQRAGGGGGGAAGPPGRAAGRGVGGGGSGTSSAGGGGGGGRSCAAAEALTDSERAMAMTVFMRGFLTLARWLELRAGRCRRHAA